MRETAEEGLKPPGKAGAMRRLPSLASTSSLSAGSETSSTLSSCSSCSPPSQQASSSSLSAFLLFLKDVFLLFFLSFVISGCLLGLYIILCILLPSPVNQEWCHSRCLSLTGEPDCPTQPPWKTSCGLSSSVGHFLFVLLILHPGVYLTCSFAYKETYRNRSARPGAIERMTWMTLLVTMISSALYVVQVLVVRRVAFYPGQIGFVALLLILHSDRSAGQWSWSRYILEIGAQVIPSLAVIGSLNFLFPLLLQRLSISRRQLIVGYALPAGFFLLSAATKQCVVKLKEKNSMSLSTVPLADPGLDDSSVSFSHSSHSQDGTRTKKTVRKIIPVISNNSTEVAKISDQPVWAACRLEEFQERKRLANKTLKPTRLPLLDMEGTKMVTEEEIRHQNNTEKDKAGKVSLPALAELSHDGSEVEMSGQNQPEAGKPSPTSEELAASKKKIILNKTSTETQCSSGECTELPSKGPLSKSVRVDPLLFMLYLTLQSIQACASISNTPETNAALVLLATSTGSSCLTFISLIALRVFRTRFIVNLQGNIQRRKARDTGKERAGEEQQEEPAAVRDQVSPAGRPLTISKQASQDPTASRKREVGSKEGKSIVGSLFLRSSRGLRPVRMSILLLSLRDSISPHYEPSDHCHSHEIKEKLSSLRRMAMNMTVGTVCSVAILVVILLCRNFVSSRLLTLDTCANQLAEARGRESGDSMLHAQTSQDNLWLSMHPQMEYGLYILVVLGLLFGFVGVLELMDMQFLRIWRRERREHLKNALLLQTFMCPFLTTGLLFAVLTGSSDAC